MAIAARIGTAVALLLAYAATARADDAEVDAISGAEPASSANDAASDVVSDAMPPSAAPVSSANDATIEALATTARELVGLGNCAGAAAVARRARALDADLYAPRFPRSLFAACLAPRLPAQPRPLPAPAVWQPPPPAFQPVRFDVELSLWAGPDDTPGTALVLRNSAGVRYARSPSDLALRLSGFLEIGAPFQGAAGGELELDASVGEHLQLGAAVSAAATGNKHALAADAVFAVGARARIADRFFLAVDGMHQTDHVNAVVFGAGAQIHGRPAYPVLAVEGGLVLLGAGVVMVLAAGGGFGPH